MKLFQYRGIDVIIGKSGWFMIFLLTMNLGNFVSAYTNAAPWVVLVLGFFLALTMVASIIAHEFGHSLVGQYYKLTIRKIEIHLFGGAAVFEGNFPSARAEFWIALAGPLVSYSICAIVGGLLFLFHQPGTIQQNIPFFILAMITFQNFILGTFNLLPIFPMDGGRILRSTLWRFTDFNRATRVACYTGFGFSGLWIIGGLFMCTGGEIPYFGEGVRDGLWSIFIGLFTGYLTNLEFKRIPKQLDSLDEDERYNNQLME